MNAQVFLNCGWIRGWQQRDLNSVYKISNCDEMSKHKWNGTAEQEECCVSDLSNWNFSVTSSSEIQLNSLAIEQDAYNLKKESVDKDAIIKELSAFIQSSEALGSKGIAELEDIIRRQNMMITKLKEDLLVLENEEQGLLIVDDILYDMDSTTGPSSSDSDSSSPVKSSKQSDYIKWKTVNKYQEE